MTRLDDCNHVEYEDTCFTCLTTRVRVLTAKLTDIATREWRDEGGRIAAAIARDGLATVDVLAVYPPSGREGSDERG